jgi:probable RNA-binding protein EIF1AD
MIADLPLLITGSRPEEFLKVSAYPEDSDEEASTVGKMPPSDSEDE